MPTCRGCGRIGPKTCSCPVISTSLERHIQTLALVTQDLQDDVAAAAAVPTKPRPTAPSLKPGRTAAANEVRGLQNNLSMLLNREDDLYTQCHPMSAGERDRKHAVAEARSELVDQVHALGDGVRKTVQAEANWRKSGLRPSHFSHVVGMRHTSLATSEATQTEMPTDARGMPQWSAAGRQHRRASSGKLRSEAGTNNALTEAEESGEGDLSDDDAARGAREYETAKATQAEHAAQRAGSAVFDRHAKTLRQAELLRGESKAAHARTQRLRDAEARPEVKLTVAFAPGRRQPPVAFASGNNQVAASFATDGNQVAAGSSHPKIGPARTVNIAQPMSSAMSRAEAKGGSDGGSRSSTTAGAAARGQKPLVARPVRAPLAASVHDDDSVTDSHSLLVRARALREKLRPGAQPHQSVHEVEGTDKENAAVRARMMAGTASDEYGHGTKGSTRRGSYAASASAMGVHEDDAPEATDQAAFHRQASAHWAARASGIHRPVTPLGPRPSAVSAGGSATQLPPRVYQPPGTDSDDMDDLGVPAWASSGSHPLRGATHSAPPAMANAGPSRQSLSTKASVPRNRHEGAAPATQPVRTAVQRASRPPADEARDSDSDVSSDDSRSGRGGQHTPSTGHKRGAAGRHDPKTAPKTRPTGPRPSAPTQVLSPSIAQYEEAYLYGRAHHPLPPMVPNIAWPFERVPPPPMHPPMTMPAMATSSRFGNSAPATTAYEAFAFAQSTLASDPTESLLDEWLYRARLRAYTPSCDPLAEDPWVMQNTHAASSALLDGLKQVAAMVG